MRSAAAAALYAITFSALLAAAPAAGHQIWLEQSDGNAAIYYGELQNNLREASPGELDDVQPTARLLTPTGERPLTAKKSATGFTLSGRTGTGESLVAENQRLPVYNRKVGDKVIKTAPTLAARHVTDFAVREPVLALDIVPMGRPGLFRLTFKGKPLAKARVDVVPESGWMRLLRTDEQGMLDTNLPWPGLYYVKAIHHDPAPGERGGVPYEAASYTTTLSFVVKDGIAPPPLPPLTPPAKPAN